MKQYQLTIKKATELEQRDIDALIKLKQQHWPYDTESQRAWMEKNIAPDDLHFLQFDENHHLIAYLDAVWIDVKLNGNPIRALGIGNVCVDKSYTKCGVGTMLISFLNFQLKSNDICGFLLCKDPLIDFYQKSNWLLLNDASITVAGAAFSHNAMGYHLPRDLGKIEKMDFSRDF